MKSRGVAPGVGVKKGRRDTKIRARGPGRAELQKPVQAATPSSEEDLTPLLEGSVRLARLKRPVSRGPAQLNAGRSGNGCERSGVILKQRFWQQPGETSA